MIIYLSFALLKIIVTLYKTHDSMEDLSKCTEFSKNFVPDPALESVGKPSNAIRF